MGFTALCTAWLTKTQGDLKLTLEKTIGTMQAVLTRTLAHANDAAQSAGLSKPSPAQMELKLIQSKQTLSSHQVAFKHLCCRTYQLSTFYKIYCILYILCGS